MSDTMTKTDKVLARKEGGVGYLTFNNPERHNAMSREMWGRTGEILDEFANDKNVRVVVLSGAGGKAFVSGADISEFEKQRANPEQVAIYNATSDKAFTGLANFPQADDCDDPRLLHRRRSGTRDLRRHAHLFGQFEVRYSGGEARSRLWLCRREAAGRSGRAFLCEGNLLHRAPVRGRTKRSRWAWSIAWCRRRTSSPM